MIETFFTINKDNAKDPAKTREDLAWEKEANAWAALYLIYDDNERHMSDSFWNNGHDQKDSKTMRAECLELAKALLDMGYDGEADEELDAELRTYFEEAKKTS